MLRLVPRLSQVWMPSGGFVATESQDAHSKLIRAGFLRQSNSGMFHLLPLGRRVQDKIENLIVKHMEGDLGRSSGAPGGAVMGGRLLMNS